MACGFALAYAINPDDIFTITGQTTTPLIHAFVFAIEQVFISGFIQYVEGY